ncbi:DUF2493 domain-containing protein [Litoreibacter roseus]|uniref:YspA cpYpsA-related SLOG domain-containing protein n=1 Tax=Litoreibacter roseus TaxID=2601869 RepID=A0A6N6JLC0_9RHOB|nr:DUF2493 domain-containing protein [Litoreibacter roseus]GFE67106.1 hypothetical protein KIN_41800 [Litoreibacter roseus]
MTPHPAPISPTSSATARALEALALHGPRPPEDEIDHRPLPEQDQTECAIAAMVEATHMLLADTQLEEDLEELLWSLTNIFHRRLGLIERRLDENEIEQRGLMRAQDGSEVKSLELERQIARGQKLIDHRDAYETMRDHAAEQFQAETGSVWLPRTGSRTSNKGLTASVIDSRNFISAERRKKNEVHCPEGTRIALTGGDYQDFDTIWSILDQTREKYPDMILLHGGTPKGAEHIASLWADNRGVAQVIFKPDWAAHNKAAPFKRNDRLLEAMPKGVIACPGSGITDNLVDKARKLGIPIKRIGG